MQCVSISGGHISANVLTTNQWS